MNESQQLLSDIVVYNKYARYRPDLKRRENWDEIIDRYIAMLLKKYCGDDVYAQFKTKVLTTEKGSLADEIVTNSKYLYNRDLLPSMRALQFAGPAIEKTESRVYNCGYLPIDDVHAFSELMFLLLGGTGVGYSVQFSHIRKLPSIQKPLKERKYLISDSIEGWSDAIKVLIQSYMGLRKYKPRYDFSDIREKGEALVTAGGKAPGPDPLRIALVNIESILNSMDNGDKLTDLQCHDICCHIADAVLAGGIRRAALISLFSMDSKDMATCKHGNWWENNPQRGRANNSAVFVRGRVKKKDFIDFWKIVKDSGSGEPGIYFTNDPNYGTNPCCEISLRWCTFCNLTELNAGTLRDQKDFNERSRVAAFFGTLQAGFTDFHYLRPDWQDNTEKDALIGVGLTGICNGNIYDMDLLEAAAIVKDENVRVANLIGINPAARTTTVKPSGTTSCVVGSSSGIHAWHSEFYIRNMQCTVGDDLYNYFVKNHPSLIKVMDYQPNSAVIGIPQKAPKTATLRENEDWLGFLERVDRFNLEWVHQGHVSGPNTNNVSATCSVKEGDWDDVGEWLWKHRDNYNGLSVLPYDGGTYKDAPFQNCTEYEYNKRMKYIRDNPIDLTKITEKHDNTNLKGELACAGGSCDLIY
jgi:ribonucleoside-diphosphate reductase alpha chain